MRTFRSCAIVAALAGLIGASAADAEPVHVSLPDYALDFPSYGFEITVMGTTRLSVEPLSADGRIRIREGGHKLRAFIDRMERDDRKAFVAFYNVHCFISLGERGCDITASGEVELDDDMRMLLRIHRAELRKGANRLIVGSHDGELTGQPRVVDGDTIDIGEERIRLQGVDTPERHQKCRDGDGATYRCGDAATEALRSFIGGGFVRCEIEPKRDRYGRAIGICFTADGADLNGWLVRQGLGLAYRKYSERYVAEEEAARAERLGMHAGAYIPPWDWRRGERLP